MSDAHERHERMKFVGRIQDIQEWLTPGKAHYYSKGDERWLEDGLRFHRIVGPQNSEDLVFGVAKLEPGEVHLLHHHDDASELYYVVEGEGKFTLDDDIVNGVPGTVIYMTAGVKHKIENEGTETLMIFFMYPRPDYTTTLDPDIEKQG